MDSDRTGVYGWIAVFCTVVGFDAWALTKKRQTLSGACWQASRHPKMKLALFMAWMGLTHHLFVESRAVEDMLDSLAEQGSS